MKRPYFQFYPADWLSSMAVTMMKPEHEGAYIRLLCYDWMNDGIPDEDAYLSVISRLVEGWFNGGSTALRPCFKQHPTKPGFITNDRIQIERKKQDEWREKSKIGGLKSSESKRKKAMNGGSTTVERVVQPKANSSTSSSSSSSTTFFFEEKGVSQQTKPAEKLSDTCPTKTPKNVRPEKRREEKSNTPPTPKGESLPFSSARFIEAWETWVKHRIEKRAKLTPTTIAATFKKMQEWGEERSIAAIWHSIGNGWQGLFESGQQATQSKPAMLFPGYDPSK